MRIASQSLTLPDLGAGALHDKPPGVTGPLGTWGRRRPILQDQQSWNLVWAKDIRVGHTGIVTLNDESSLLVRRIQ